MMDAFAENAAETRPPRWARSTREPDSTRQDQEKDDLHK
jgi:hypothetical protein